MNCYTSGSRFCELRQLSKVVKKPDFLPPFTEPISDHKSGFCIMYTKKAWTDPRYTHLASGLPIYVQRNHAHAKRRRSCTLSSVYLQFVQN